METYIAFLRGINVGGHQKVNMEDLRALFTSIGFSNVKTLLNSGNVIFDAPEQSAETLQLKIEQSLEQKYGYKISTIVRSKKNLQKLSDRKVFKDITITKETRLYVTFLTEPGKGTISIPYKSPEGQMEILAVIDNVVFSVVVISNNKNTTDLMGVMDKEYGKKVTTRNWNTIEKLIK